MTEMKIHYMFSAMTTADRERDPELWAEQQRAVERWRKHPAYAKLMGVAEGMDMTAAIQPPKSAAEQQAELESGIADIAEVFGEDATPEEQEREEFPGTACGPGCGYCGRCSL